MQMNSRGNNLLIANYVGSAIFSVFKLVKSAETEMVRVTRTCA